VKVLGILLAVPIALVLVIGIGMGILEGPTTCELIVDNRGSSPLTHGAIALNRSPGAKRDRKLSTIPPRTRVTFELDEFYTEDGGELAFTRADGSKITGRFGYIDGGETWRYRMVVTDDTSTFSAVMIDRAELRARP